VLWDLCRRIWLKKHPGGDESELYLMFGAFLLARARYLADARRYLLQAGRAEVTAPFIEELDEMATEIREQEWTEHWKRVQMLHRAGNRTAVHRYIEQLKTYYPDQYKAHKADVQALLEGDAAAP